MSKQKIVVIPIAQYDLEYFGHKEFDSVAEFNTWAKEVEGKLDVSKGVKIFVGEERCAEIQAGRASNQYKITLAGCNCGKRASHDPALWDRRHGIGEAQWDQKIPGSES